jgi:hypothetical protein
VFAISGLLLSCFNDCGVSDFTMKAITILSIPLLASAAAVENVLCESYAARNGRTVTDRSKVKRQSGGLGDIFGLGVSSGSKAPVSAEKTPAKINSGAVRERILWGPYKLQRANVCSHDLTLVRKVLRQLRLHMLPLEGL